MCGWLTFVKAYATKHNISYILDMAKRIIAYKNKISEQWLEKKENIQNKSESEDDDNDNEEPPKKEMVLTKINKK